MREHCCDVTETRHILSRFAECVRTHMFSPGGRLLLALLVCGAGVLSLFSTFLVAELRHRADACHALPFTGLAWLPNECVMSYSYPSYHQVDLPAGCVLSSHCSPLIQVLTESARRAGSSYRLFAYVEAHGPGA